MNYFIFGLIGFWLISLIAIVIATITAELRDDEEEYYDFDS